MTTVWRPRVRIDVPDVGDVENNGYIERGVDQEGHEAEESPEALRAVRARGEVPLVVQGVRACPHGRQRSQCKECGGSGICEHGRQAL